ncbi:sodium/iodide co-transporter [Pseudonocardia sp. Ae168_Ps1]|nr:sodium/iodide co-transporter [Pseudonocardia sp. Ae150A_Ps1]OLL78105.1 sodium/iodide co-transporter [Pseudonocardia sp. Ae168_Ps1]OLL87771.1 sodium/iodide co-transporter [Pseudonocardia sp. Ae263_Ps1]OLL92203.1 sodium/iodide co-transporter [Pseudonocardia sp. Ae356_Ps1]
MLRTLDLIVIVAYLVLSLGIGLWMAGRQRSNEDYFLGGREMPWWAISLSVVATETSALTVISVPTVAYLGSLTYLQLALGYLIGRIVVAFVLLPRYAAGSLTTAYGYLGQRFGRGMQGTASVAFLLTRLLADGVRMFAAAIPVKVILAGMGLDVSFFWIIVVLSLVTVAYTYVGGIKAVVWTDVLQMGLYVAGGIVALAVIGPQLPAGFWDDAVAAGKTQLLDFTSSPLSAPYAFVTAVVGGALLSMASHGVDQIIVQRLLSCRTVRDGQKALIFSAVVVGVQFALFLVVGLFLWGYYGGATPGALGLETGDELFPKFIVEGLPAGVSGLLLAGILAAAMSTLSSSLSALSSSTVIDLVQTLSRRELSAQQGIRLSRFTTLVWGLVFIVFANLFTSTEDPVVELGLSVAGITYGGLLGAFALGIVVRRARQADAIVAFAVAVVVMGSLFLFAPDAVGFTWYTAIGLVITMVLGVLLSLRHRTRATEESADDPARSSA